MTIERRVLSAMKEGLDDLRPIGARCNLSVGQVRRAVDRLRDKGHVIHNRGLYVFWLQAVETRTAA